MLFWLCLVGGLILDQLTKLVVVSNMAVGQSIPLIREVFHLTYVLNDGAAFNILRGQRWFFLVITLVALIAVLVYLRTVPRREYLTRLALGLFCGGALGNFVDRMLRGQVVDFLDFRFFPVFNLADCCIVVGCGLLVIAIFRAERKAKKEAADDAAND